MHMKQYLVLRNNKESGPFSREELEVFGLTDRDLVWIEGQSTTWEHPGSLDDLKHISEVTAEAEPLPHQAVQSSTKIGTDLSLQEYLKIYASDASALSSSSPKNTPLQPAGRDSRDSYVLLTKFFGFGVLLAGLLLCGAVVTQFIKSFDNGQNRVSEAVEIRAEKLPVSTTQHTALSVPADTIEQAVGFTDSAAQSSFAAPATQAAKPSTTQKTTTKPGKKQDTATKQPLAQEAAPAETQPEKPVEEAPPPPPVDFASAVRLSANEFKTGMFGGVSGLEITITNNASKKISRAVIEVDFLKPNGNVVKTQTVVVEDVAAGGAKTVPVPSSNRGVKVQYRLVSAE